MKNNLQATIRLTIPPRYPRRLFLHPDTILAPFSPCIFLCCFSFRLWSFNTSSPKNILIVFSPQEGSRFSSLLSANMCKPKNIQIVFSPQGLPFWFFFVPTPPHPTVPTPQFPDAGHGFTWMCIDLGARTG